MDKKDYSLFENYMLSCMRDAAHDKEHIYRVLYNALIIAETENAVDYDVLITACLLHDIGREAQFKNPAIDHAEYGGEMAREFIVKNGYAAEFAERVKSCIVTHRFRKSNPPATLEAKILFDADKLDVTGAMGIARTLAYKATVDEPLYRLDGNGMPTDGSNDTDPSFFGEYKFKLEKLYDKFFTQKAREIASGRAHAAKAFYDSLYSEVAQTYENGKHLINERVK